MHRKIKVKINEDTKELIKNKIDFMIENLHY